MVTLKRAKLSFGETTMTEETKEKPIRDFTSGRARASIWKRTGEHGPFYRVTVDRMFKREGADHWEYSKAFGPEDLPKLAQVLADANNWIETNPVNTDASAKQAAA